MYDCDNIYVKWNGVKSDVLYINNGVKQSGVLNPILFNSYTYTLLIELRYSGVGCYIGNIMTHSFSYADDLVILSSTVIGLF